MGSDFLFGHKVGDIFWPRKKGVLKFEADKGIQFREMWATISVPWCCERRGKSVILGPKKSGCFRRSVLKTDMVGGNCGSVTKFITLQ